MVPDRAAPILIVSASMGHGHDAVAGELCRRLRRYGCPAEVVDLLAVLPAGVGPALRGFYAWQLRRAPWLYDAIYRLFFTRPGPGAGRASPAVLAAARALRAVVATRRPRAVVATFHLAGLATGRLREQGVLGCPAITFVTDAAVHALWLSRGVDLFLCVTPGAAARVEEAAGRPALATGPVVAPAFRPRLPGRAAVRRRLGIAPADRAVLVTAGSWGTGSVEATARLLAADGCYRPVVACGRNPTLARRLAGIPGCVPLGWADDMAELLAAVDAVVENAGGLVCFEALAAGVPLVTFRPLPGHGRHNVARLAEEGLCIAARDDAELLAALGAVTVPAARRDALVRAGQAIFRGDAAGVVAAAAGYTGGSRPPRGPARREGDLARSPTP